MQILPVFSIYDTKAQHFGAPHVQQNKDVAIRAFSHAVNTPGNPFFDHPEDYVLFEVGTFDDETAVLSPITPINHGLAASYKKAQQ